MHNKELKQKVENWWNENPMDYNVVEGEGGNWAFFRNIDRKIIKWLDWAQTGYPLLSNLINYKELRGKKVLDIGCGTGWSSEQFVRMGGEVTAIDLNSRAVELTKKRFNFYNLKGDILKADAEKLPFPDNCFDYVLSWGVLHHTPNTDKAVDEIYRVLKKGGKAGVMMYHKDSLKWWYFIWFGKGIVRLKLLKYSLQELANRYTDGAYTGGNMLTKFYTKSELYGLCSRFRSCKVAIYDSVGLMDKIPHRTLPLTKYILPTFIKKFLVSKIGGCAWINVEK